MHGVWDLVEDESHQCIASANHQGPSMQPRRGVQQGFPDAGVMMIGGIRSLEDYLERRVMLWRIVSS